MDTKYINLKFESNNKILEVGKGKSYRLLNIDGIDSGEFEIEKTSNVLSDGSTIKNKKIKDRSIMVELEHIGQDKENKRREMASFFNVHHEGILTIDYQGIKRSIIYNTERYKAKLDNLYHPFSFLVFLHCPNPFWLDESETSEEIVNWIGGISFPLRLPTRFAMAGPKIINIVNDGDVETPIKLEIYGPATRPKITLKETGEYLRINKILTADDVVTITTEFGNKRVEFNGENAFNILDLPSSKFFSLQVGDNVLELMTEDESDNVNVKVSYRNRYIGV